MRFSAFCEYTYDEEGHRFAEYGICCKTGSTDVKIRGITLEKSEINELLAMLRSGRPEMCHIQYIIEIYNRRFYNAEEQRHIVR